MIFPTIASGFASNAPLPVQVSDKNWTLIGYQQIVPLII